MLYDFLLLFVVIHVALWVIGILTERGGFILVAITLLFVTMTMPLLVIQYPSGKEIIQIILANNTTATVQNVTASASLKLNILRDPLITLAQLPLLYWYIWSYYELVNWGEELELGGFD